ARDSSAPPAMKVQVLLEYLLEVSPELCRSRLSREEAVALALRWFPISPPLLSQCAEHYFQRGDYRRAAGLLERLVDLGKTSTHDKSRWFDPGLVGEDALM